VTARSARPERAVAPRTGSALELLREGRAAERDRLVLEHLPLLRHVVGRMAVPSGLEREDLESFGMLGLIAAADAWEPSRGLQFSTFAFPKIRGAILDELRKQDFLPRGRRERLRDLDRAIARFEQTHGVAPAPEEIAAELGLEVEEIDEILATARIANELSLDAEGSESTLGALLSDPRSEDPIGSAQWNEMKALLVAAIQALGEQERTVITLYYGEELLLREISEILGVTESRVSQIHSRALYRMNRSLCAAAGEDGVGA
jgi:RNA polymerase sigma factor for flagellar operon FliA